jgi:hypothetical protein
MAVSIKKGVPDPANVITFVPVSTAANKSEEDVGATGTDAPDALSAAHPSKNKKKQGHAKPLPLTLDLNQPGRLRVGHLMNLLSISHATLYARMLTGVLPKPDGKDGKRPYWKTSTIRPLLER